SGACNPVTSVNSKHNLLSIRKIRHQPQKVLFQCNRAGGHRLCCIRKIPSSCQISFFRIFPALARSCPNPLAFPESPFLLWLPVLGSTHSHELVDPPCHNRLIPEYPSLSAEVSCRFGFRFQA